MKKLLNIIGASVILSSSAVVASCSLDPSAPIEINDAIDLQNFFNKLQNNRPELSSDYNVAFDGQNAKYIAALEEIFDQEKVVRTPFIQKLLKADFYDNDKSTIGYDIQKTGQVLGGGSLVRDGDHKVKPDVVDKNLSDYFYEKVAKPDEKPVDNRVALSTVITSKNLDELANNDADTILKAVKSKNSDLSIDEVEVKDIKDKSATVAAKSGSTVYTGSVSVTFTTTPVDTTKPLTADLTVVELGDIKDNKEATILAAVKAKNAAVDETQLEVADITNKGATINVIKDSKVYDAGGSVSVTYTVTPDVTTKPLTDDLTDVELGDIESNDETTILAAVKAKNVAVDETQLEVADITDTGATINVISGSTVYDADGSVPVTFAIIPASKPLTDDLTDVELGDIKDNKEATILAAVKAKNTAVDETQLEVADITDTGATINVISGSTVYDADGSVPVTFAIIPASKPLTADLTVVELGDIKDNKEATILAAVKAKNTAVDETQLEVADITDTGATINVISGSTVYDADGSVPVTFAIIPASKPLTDDLTDVELGDIESNDETTILAAVKAKNAAVDETQLEVADITDTGATINVIKDSKVYDAGGSVPVTFAIIPASKPLTDDLTDVELGDIESNDETTILAAVKAKNTAVDETQLEVVDITDTGATINVVSGSTVYDADGNVPVTFAIIPASKPLTDDLTDVELGDIKSNDETTILAAVKAKNTAVDETQLEVVDITDTGATINVISGSTVYDADGSVPVKFKVAEASTMNYYSILNTRHLLADGPEYSYNDYTMTIMIGSEDLLNLDNNGYVYIPFTILPE
jgi:aspartate carbamoyltransferase regulatory subunit